MLRPALLLALTAGAAPLVHAQDQIAEPVPTNASVSGGDYWGANFFPNYTLINQDGEPMRFFDDCIKGRVVLVSFIYTSCPDACPLETARIAEVQGILGDRVGKDVFFFSISIDPEVDTPPVLKEYAQRYQAGPGWQFLTGKKEEIAHLRQKLGMFDPAEESKLSDHGLNILIGNQKTGRWQMSGPFENPYVLAKQMGEWLHNWKLPPTTKRDYGDAPAIRNISEGEAVFRTRCASCHAIGGTNTQLARLGPNLFGVLDRRERPWLERWITEPDAMLAEKDPIAIQMFEAYNKVAMPNMRLSPEQVTNVLEFIAEETQRVATTTPKSPAAAAGDGAEVHACCAKKDNAVVDASAKKADTAKVAEPEAATSLSIAAALSIAAGIALAAATAFFGRRRAV